LAVPEHILTQPSLRVKMPAQSDGFIVKRVLRRAWRNRFGGSRLGIITQRRILYWLVATVVVLVAGTIIGLIWADTSNVAGLIAVVTNIAGAVAIVCLLIALAVVTRRQRRQQRHPHAA
jgi:uncharacterized membrane protein